MKSKLCICFFIFTFAFSCLLGRITGIMNEEEYKEKSSKQSGRILNAAYSRGTIYDRDFSPLVNKKYKYVAACSPNNYSADALFKSLGPESASVLKEKLDLHSPFIIDVPNDDIYSYGIDIFEVPQRYEDEQTAVHIIGETSNMQRDGISGLEKCYDTLLKTMSGEITLKYPANAVNSSVYDSVPEIYNTLQNIKGGIVTTIDKDIQALAEKAGSSLNKGAVVVMSPLNGDILACASFPSYNPNDIASSLTNPSEPLINRAFYPFAVGSTFKLLTSATAIEEGIPLSCTYNCKGYIKMGSNIFRCHKLAGHGELNMVEALEKSCNPYFINLSSKINGQSLLKKAKLLGFGEKTELGPGYFTMSGKLPQEKDLSAPEALANFAFGQGDLLATPVQIASMVSAFACHGKAFVPRLVEGSTSDGVSFSNHAARFEPTDIIHPDAADKVRDMMISVVENGSGKKAKPRYLGAGGKTASAQSGQFKDGEEIVHAWFSGFYPAKEPKYVIVVLAEGAFSGGDEAAPVFKEICDGIYELKGEKYLKENCQSSYIK